MKPSTDTVPAMLTPGEFVIRKDAAEEIGPEKLHMLNNIDRLGQSALLENARSPMGYQEGGDVKSGGFFSLFKDKVGGFFEQQGKNWERAAEMEEKIGVRNPFLKTAEEQLALQGKKQLTPEPIYRPEIASGPMEVGKSPEMLGDASLYSSPTEQAYQESLPAQEQIARKYGILQEAGQPTQLGVRSQDPKQLLEKTLAGIKAEYTPTEQAYLKSLPAMDEIERKYQIQEILTSKAPDMGMRLSDSLDVHPTMLAMQNPGRPYVKPGGSEVAPMLSDVAMPNDWTNQFELPETVEDWGRAPEEPRVSWGDLSAYDKLGMMLMGENKWDNLRGKSRRIMSGKEGSAQGYDYEIPGAPTFRDVMGFQEGGQVMHNEGEGQIKDTLSVFGEKSQDADGLQKLAAVAAMQQMQQAQQVQQAVGMQEGGSVVDILKRAMAQYGQPVEEGMYTPQGGRTELGYAKEHGLTPESVNIDTLSFRNPANYLFRISGEKPSGETITGTERATGALPLKMDVGEAMGKHYKDDPFGELDATIALQERLEAVGRPAKEDREKQMMMKALGMSETEYDAFMAWKKKKGKQEGGYVNGYQGGGYIPQYQQGGPVKPPMSGGEEGPQQVPMSSGQQAYHKPPMEQLGMDPFEYDSYLRYGPEMYKYFAQKYKPKTEWTVYDSLVDSGQIDPYEVSKDSINVLTDDQLNELVDKSGIRQ